MKSTLIEAKKRKIANNNWFDMSVLCSYESVTTQLNSHKIRLKIRALSVNNINVPFYLYSNHKQLNKCLEFILADFDEIIIVYDLKHMLVAFTLTVWNLPEKNSEANF